ncbi:copper resistance protein CopC [Georgenia sp. 10Sc9-8]|uniref:Copper resistance protein CopC n=1 Tax=Georgenia halotolerans TaxID=3028317 RepID=A0ABT5TYK4_9MICO|nr:copper resistance protein CopC [Georgenia halotolerans]
MTFSPRPRPVTRPVLVTALLLLLAVAGLAPPALGHDVLVEAEPADGAVLETPPREVVLRYSNEVLELSPAMIVRTADGRTVADGTPSVDGRTVTLTLPQVLDDGTYEVEWSVVSSDGHRIQGEHVFEVAATGAEQAGTDDEQAGAATDEQAGAATDEQPAADTDEPAGAADGTVIEQGSEEQPGSAQDGTLSDLPGWLRVVIGVVAVGAVAALVVLVVRRLRTES